MSSKVINTILKLQDRMSKPMEAAAGKIKKAKEQVTLAKKAVEKLQIVSVKHQETINNAKMKIRELQKTYGKNSLEVKKARIALKKYKLESQETNLKLKTSKEKLNKLSFAFKKNSLAVKAAREKIKNMGTTINNSITKTIKKAVKTIATLATAIGTLGVVTGFKEAFNLEGYKLQLETATKSTEKAGKLMANAIKFANNTPFETGEVVEATAKMESQGMSSIKWLVDVADMAGATNKSIDQATEAMVDATMGQFERLTQFGIKKEMIMAKAAKECGEGIVFNKKGQVLDRAKLEDVLQKLLREKFEGGAAKQASSVKGLWSTIMGVTKFSLAKIIGMQIDGTARQGSLYDKLRIQLKKVVEVLNKWLEDGTIDKIATQVTNAVNSMISSIKGVVDWVIKYQDEITFLLAEVGTIYTIVKAYKAWKATVIALKEAQLMLNLAMEANPFGLIVLGITLAIPLVIALYKKFEWFRNLINGIWKIIKMAVKGTCEILKALFNPFKAIGKIIDKIKGIGNTEIKVSEKKSIITKDESNKIQKEISDKNNIVKTKHIEEKEVTKLKKIKMQDKVIPSISNSKNQVSNSSKNINITINMNGDFYGWEDFKEKVSKAVVEAFESNAPNVVGVK
ncbi:hypothetical protein [Fusobacterium sp. IOR10]|uniref:hypothetical protein n=1 Tax=Fusobacterium sp. IOR10 TaxID=2665157 RepID=UPI0013D24D09|nr:hypothetical protein [Fusobacterium sp. IOR10]